MNHKVSIYSEKRGLGARGFYPLIRRTVKAVLDCEGVGAACRVGVILTDNEGIRQVNSRTRGMDKPTDVLSFPMLELEPGAPFMPADYDIDPETGLVFLGDVMVSLDRVAAQARQYGNNFETELSYLIVHSALHLLGYDHVDEAEDKRRMRAREETVMSVIRNGDNG